jgi:DUF4097 and DUF4098 domain-containing protein YvlB
MKPKLAFVFVLLIFVSAAWADEITVDHIDRTFSVSGRPSIEIKNEDGHVSVKAVPGSSVHVVATKEVHRVHSSKAAREAADRVKVRIEQSGNRIEVEAIYPKFHFSIFSGPEVLVHFEVTAPPETDLQVHNADGAVDADGFQGAIQLSSADGNISAQRLSGQIRVSTADGNLELSKCEGNLDLSSSDGDIVADECKAQLKVHSADGPVNIKRFAGSIDADASDGKIFIDGVLSGLTAKTADGRIEVQAIRGSEMQSDWSLRSSDGSIKLELPESFAGDIDLSTSDGHIHTDQPVTISGAVSTTHLSGKLNGGGSHLLQIHTADGNIDLTKPLSDR